MATHVSVRASVASARVRFIQSGRGQARSIVHREAKAWMLIIALCALMPVTAQAQTPSVNTSAMYEWRGETVGNNGESSASIVLSDSGELNFRLPPFPQYEVDLTASASASGTTVSTHTAITVSLEYGGVIGDTYITTGTGYARAAAGVFDTFMVAGPWDAGTRVWLPVELSLSASTGSTQPEMPAPCPFCADIVFGRVNASAQVDGRNLDGVSHSSLQADPPSQHVVLTEIGAAIPYHVGVNARSEAQARLAGEGSGLDSIPMMTSQAGGTANLNFADAILWVQDVGWTNTDGGLFSDGDNWATGIPPDVDNAAVFNEPGLYTISLDGHASTEWLRAIGGGVDVTLDLAGHQFSTDELEIQEGAGLTITAGLMQVWFDAMVAQGALSVAGEVAELDVYGMLTVGQDGPAMLRLETGGSADVAGRVTLGVEAGADGRILVGDGSTFAAEDGMTIGQAGDGQLVVAQGATAKFVGDMVLGSEPGSSGSIRVEGADAELELKGDLTIADAGSGNVSVLGGGAFVTKELEDDDEQVIAEGKTRVGVQLGSTGSIMVAGEDAAFTSKGGLTLGGEGNGVIQISGGGAFTARDGAKFGAELGSTGDASVVGADSTLTIHGALTLGDAGTGRLLVGDDAAASAAAMTMGKQLNAMGELIVSGGMSVFEVEGALIAGAAGGADVLVEAGGRLDSASLTLGAEAFVQDRVVTIEDAGSLLHTGETLVGHQGNGVLVIRAGGRVESGIDPATPAGATLGHGAFGDGSVLISGDGSEWKVGGELTVGDGGFGIIDVKLGGRLTTAGGALGATGNGGPGHVTVIDPHSRWDSSEAIVLAGTGLGDADPGPGTGQAILNVMDGGTVEAPHLTLGAGLAPGHLNVRSGGELVARDGITLRWGNMEVDGPITAVRSPDGALAVGNARASFTDGALGSFDQVFVQAPPGGGNVSELGITDSTIEATNTHDPAVIVGGEAGGTIRLANGLLDAAGGEVHIVDHGSLLGTGTVRGNVVVTGSGFVAPGLSPGTLTVEGDFVQGPDSVLHIEFAGLGAGQSDLLLVTGDAFLGGTLALSFIDGFAPQADDQLTFLLVSGALTGDFDEVLVHNLAAGFAYDLAWDAGALQMQALNAGAYVPLPAPWLLLVGGCALLLGFRRRASEP